MRHLVLTVLGVAVLASCARDGDRPLRVAVAANFAAPFEAVAAEYRATTGVATEVVVGSTGLLYAQIENGAPLDLFLAADAERPERLERSGRVADGGRATYAYGRLALIGSALESGVDLEEQLASARVMRLAIANPDLAPYGAAAMEVLERTGTLAALEGRIVRAENVAQAFSFAHTGGVELAFVSLAQARAREVPHREVPPSLHAPIRQDVVVLRGARREREAAALLALLRSEAVQRRLESLGYARADG